VGSGLFVAGHHRNACVRAQVVTATSENALYPKSNLQNGFPWKPFRFNTAGVDLEVKFDANLLTVAETGFETYSTGAAPGGRWSTLAGTPTVELAPAAGHGANSLQLNAAGESSGIDLELAAGRNYGINFSLYANGGEFIDVYVLNLETGKYRTSSSWTTTKTALQTHSAASWSNYILNILAEPLTWGYIGGAARHRIFAEKRSGTATAFIDDVQVFPYCSFASMHNYSEIPDGLSVLVQSSPDDSTWTTRGTLAAGRRFRNYISFTVQVQRYWKFLISGTTLFIPSIGQTVLAEAITFITKPSWGMVTARKMPKLGRDDLPLSLAASPRYRFEMSWESKYSAYQQIADEMLGASNFGDEPILIIPDVVDLEVVYGRGARLSSIDARSIPIDTWEYSLTLEDDAYSVLTK